jgi:hypothetical protein
MKLRSWSLLTACFIALVLLGYVFGCTRGLHIDTYTADDGTTIDRMLGNEIDMIDMIRDYPSSWRVSCYLDAQRSQDGNGNVTYNLFLTNRRCDTPWLDMYLRMYKGGALTLIIDKQPVVLSGEGDFRREKEGSSGYVDESLSYTISADILRNLADAHEVEVKVTGQGGPLEGYFSSQNLANFKRFFEKYGNPADRSAAQKQ